MYVDRSGEEQTLREHVLTWDEINYYVGVCVDRLSDVIQAQEKIDAGEVEWARSLRDQVPSFCYSPKVMCPFRDLCWKGPDSEWYPTAHVIEDEDSRRNVAKFIQARDLFRTAEAYRKEAREELRQVEGLYVEDGNEWSVHWERGALYVTPVKKGKGE